MANVLYTAGSINQNASQVHIATIMTHHENIAAARSHGSMQGEAAKSLDSTKMRCKIWRLATPTTSTSTHSWHHTGMLKTEEATDGDLEEQPRFAGSRRFLVTTSSGTTQIPAWSGSFTQSVFALPAITLPFAINKVANVIDNNGMMLSELPTVSATATHYVGFYNPHFYSSQASQVIAPVLSLQLQAFGMQEVVLVTNLPPASQIVLDFQLKRVPSATRNSKGQHQVAACAYWDGNMWEINGCSLDKVVVTDSGAQDVRAICKCTVVGQHKVLDLPAGCDGVPFSTLIWDKCLMCGEDDSTCKGCDGVANSGAKYDGCQGMYNPKGLCGGDNSTCAGCDGIPNIGTVLDVCSVSGGDNSTFKGCHGILVHLLVTARTGLRPKVFDNCMSQQNPRGVCGGCDASCKGCDGRVNSGKRYDKCGRCGDFTNIFDAANNGVGPNSWYSRSSVDNCTLGLELCATGFVPDDCGTCIPFGSGPDVRNQACQGCDNRAGVCSYQYGHIQIGGKVADQCGVCGGNDCFCVDCKGVVGGKSLYDRCGVCHGNSTCLDCAGTSYGVKALDVCGICGGNNVTRNCWGCDGMVYPLLSVPPQFDCAFVCCAGSLISCNNTCYSSIGCDGVCSKDARSIDSCGICGGTNAPNTGTCDCAGIPNGPSRIGCDGQCSATELPYTTTSVTNTTTPMPSVTTRSSTTSEVLFSTTGVTATSTPVPSARTSSSMVEALLSTTTAVGTTSTPMFSMTISTIEVQSTTTGVDTTSTPMPSSKEVCGNSARTSGEECDDENSANGDGCSNKCTVEYGYYCTGGGPTSLDTCVTICGDGKLAGDEKCDDGNIKALDGCSTECSMECGFVCDAAEPQSCTSECGDGIRASDEVCDDGNTANGDGRSTCKTTEPGWECDTTTACPQTSCEQSAAGKYELDGVCRECTAGTHLSTEGSFSSQDCIECEAGKFSNRALTACDTCPDGSNLAKKTARECSL